MENLPSVKTAVEYPYSEFELRHVQELRKNRVIGTPDQVKEKLLAMAEDYQIEEILINTPIHNEEARIRSYSLIADAFGMAPIS